MQLSNARAWRTVAAMILPVVVCVSCTTSRRADDLSAATTSSTLAPTYTSGSTPATQVATSTTIDPLAPTTLAFDPSLPPCSDAVPNLLLTPTGDVSVVHVTLKIADRGVTGRTDGGYPVLNAALAAGNECQLGDGPSQRVVTPGRAPRWDFVSVDGALPDPDVGRDIAHLTGRNETTQVFYNCVDSDPTVNLADALATIVATSSLTCRSSISIHAA